MNTKLLARSLTVGLSVLALMGCGASKQADSSSDLASRAAVADVTQSQGNVAWAYCNSGTQSSLGFKMSLAAYYENNNLRYDLMNMSLASMPSGFLDGSLYFQMFRWQANTSGSSYIDPTPLPFSIINRSGGGQILANRNDLRWSYVSSAANKMGTNVTTFFQSTFLVVNTRDPLGQFDVIRLVAYKSADNSVAGYVDVLMPVFHADPNVYAIENGGTRSPLLMALHPFLSKKGQGWASADYQTWANGMCDM